jgi:hypothetical protein
MAGAGRMAGLRARPPATHLLALLLRWRCGAAAEEQQRRQRQQRERDAGDQHCVGRRGAPRHGRRLVRAVAALCGAEQEERRARGAREANPRPCEAVAIGAAAPVDHGCCCRAGGALCVSAAPAAARGAPLALCRLRLELARRVLAGSAGPRSRPRLRRRLPAPAAAAPPRAAPAAAAARAATAAHVPPASGAARIARRRAEGYESLLDPGPVRERAARRRGRRLAGAGVEVRCCGGGWGRARRKARP